MLGIVRDGKCPGWEFSGMGHVWGGKSPCEKCLNGKSLAEKCLVRSILVGNVRLGNVQVGNVWAGKVLEDYVEVGSVVV